MTSIDQAVQLDEQAAKHGRAGAQYLPVLFIQRAAIEFPAQRPDVAAADACRELVLLQDGMQAEDCSSNVGLDLCDAGACPECSARAQPRRRTAARRAAEQLRQALGEQQPETQAAVQLAATTDPAAGAASG